MTMQSVVLLPSKFLLGYNNKSPFYNLSIVLLPSKFLLGYNIICHLKSFSRSATIEIFARLQHMHYNRNHQISSATIEIFARLQL